MNACGEVIVRRKVQFRWNQRQKEMLNVSGSAPGAPPGRVPRVARLMALAIRFQKLVSDGQVASFAQLAQFSHVSRARLTQIMNFTLLAPDIQEALLFLPRTAKGRDPLRERELRPLMAQPDWQTQRRMWARLIALCFPSHRPSGTAAGRESAS